MATRQIVAESVNARITGRAADDVVLLVGSGTTAAVVKLVQLLGLHIPLPAAAAAAEDGDGDGDGDEDEDEDDEVDVSRPVVFVGPFEHHSNLLPWRESCAKVVHIRESPTTRRLDQGHLRAGEFRVLYRVYIGIIQGIYRDYIGPS